MRKQDAVGTWLFSGVWDLYAGFIIDDLYFNKQSVFLTIMGLEMILKAYVLEKMGTQGQLENAAAIYEQLCAELDSLERMFLDMSRETMN